MTGKHGTTVGDQDYYSYLLRLWRANSAGDTAWRASLENPHTGERTGFSNLEALFCYLREQIGAGRSTIETIEGGVD